MAAQVRESGTSYWLYRGVVALALMASSGAGDALGYTLAAVPNPASNVLTTPGLHSVQATIKFDLYDNLYATPEEACNAQTGQNYKAGGIVVDYVELIPAIPTHPQTYGYCDLYSRSWRGEAATPAKYFSPSIGKRYFCGDNGKDRPITVGETPPTCPTQCPDATWLYYDSATDLCWKPTPCPIDPLPDLLKDDLCTQSLEAGSGKDVNHACGSMTPEMERGAVCLADKIHKLGISYSEPSATIRTEAYQNHLLAVWKKSLEIEEKVLTDEDKLACAAIIADVDNEMNIRHGIDSEPSSKGNQGPHVRGRAIDIPKDIAKAMKVRVSNTTFATNCIFCMPYPFVTIGDVEDYVNNAQINPPACNLRWGGRFSPVDRVHFQLP